MTSTITGSLHFASHLLGLIIALGAALVISRDEDRSRLARVAGGLAFGALAAAEAFHGGEFGGDASDIAALIRTGAYVGLLAATLLTTWRRETAAALIFPGDAVPAAFAASAAALAALWSGRRRPHELRLAIALACMGAAEAFLRLGTEANWVEVAYHVVRTLGFAGLVWYIVPLTKRSIQFRFVVGFVGLLLAIVLGVSSAIAEVIARNQRAEALGRVQGQAEATERGLRERSNDTVARLVALSQTLAPPLEQEQVFTAEDMESIQRVLFPVEDFVVFLSEDRRLLGWTGVSPGEATELAGTDVVEETIGTERETVSVTERGAEGLAYVAAAPVLDRDDLVAVAVAGFLLDEELLKAVAPRGSGAAVFRGAIPVPVAATGFPTWTPGEFLVPPSVVQRAWSGFLAGQPPLQEAIDVEGVQSFASLLPLERSDDRPVGVLLVTEPAALVTSPQRARVNRTLFLATVAVIALALLFAILIARRITRPIRVLTTAARQVQAGDLSTKAAVGGEDEVGELASAFNRMTSSLEAMTDELRETADEQASLRGRLETVLDSMGDGLLASDRSGRVVACNPEAERILGIPRGRIVGRSVDKILRVQVADGEPAADGQMTGGLGFVARSDGSRVPIAITSSPLRDGSGESAGQVYLLRDMTREHEVERMKAEFLSNVSHELRTPLTPIVGYSEILAGKKVPPGRTREFADGILKSARRLERIVGMVVDYAAIEGGRMSVTRERVSMRKLLLEAVQEWRERSAKHEFSAAIAKGLPAAYADSALVRRALEEIMDNAVKYSPDGGRVRVSATGATEDGRERLLVEVSDEGIGIESEDLPAVFQDFRQVDASDTRLFGGLGLGLAFVKRIIEAHGGTISISSRPGEGTTLRFTLPTADTVRGRRKRTG